MHINKNIILLLLAQGISGAVVSLLTFSSTLAGKYLADGYFSLDGIECQKCASKSLMGLFNLSTLPVSMSLCGAFIAIFFSSSAIERLGRKSVFLLSCVIGILGAILGIFALLNKSFWFFCLATFLLGFFTALNGFYRFLASEAIKTSNENATHKATALIVGGGVLGGILGPNLAHLGINLSQTLFVGSFVFALLLCVLNLFLTLPLKLLPPEPKIKAYTAQPTKDKNFIIATLSCACGFAFMTLMMNSAPLAMSANAFDLKEAKDVLVWHFIAMYAPSLFFAFLLKNIKPLNLVLVGMGLYALAGFTALLWQDFWGFLFSLVLVDIAWAFSFNAGTFLLNSINSANKIKLQGLNTLFTFGANFIASISVGALLANGGWILINVILLILVFCFFVVFILLFKKIQKRLNSRI